VTATPLTIQIQAALLRYRAGEPTAREELLTLAYERLRVLTRSLLLGYPRVKASVLTDDVLQNSAIRLLRALEVVQPEEVRGFFGLAAMQIRRELLDLARSLRGAVNTLPPNGQLEGAGCDFSQPSFDPADPTDGPLTLSQWTELHAAIDRLPEQEREIFDILYYHGVTQAAAAQILGVTERTVKRRWRNAKLALFHALNGTPPWT
jgi:RNA polymerase sigma-70 factor (ECF subfamily)